VSDAVGQGGPVISQSVRIVADSIARHLVVSPGCADSAEGIQRWWLQSAGGEASLDVVLEGLQMLEKEGIVECRRLGTREIWILRRGAD